MVSLSSSSHASMGDWGGQRVRQPFQATSRCGSDAVWTELNPSLMAATVLSGGEAAGRACTWCFNADHSSRDCALASLEEHTSSPKNAYPPNRPARLHPHRQQDEICRRFNKGTCSSASCKFDHICTNCQRPGHGSHECKKGVQKNSSEMPSSSPRPGQP